jgi:hypothetical protein
MQMTILNRTSGAPAAGFAAGSRCAAPLLAVSLVLALALALTAGCAGRGDHAAAGHPETFDAAKALAAKRQVPLLVDFYSPT